MIKCSLTWAFSALLQAELQIQEKNVTEARSKHHAVHEKTRKKVSGGGKSCEHSRRHI
jgi:hypothetical protein